MKCPPILLIGLMGLDAWLVHTCVLSSAISSVLVGFIQFVVLDLCTYFKFNIVFRDL